MLAGASVGGKHFEDLAFKFGVSQWKYPITLCWLQPEIWEMLACTVCLICENMQLR